jgi:hypothetical protein
MTTLVRVAVAGKPVWVRGETAYQHLVRVDRQLDIAHSALRRIAATDCRNDNQAFAAKALEDMQNA